MTLKQAKTAVTKILGSKKKGGLWWTVPNPQFGNLVPDNLVKIGRSKHVIQFIMEAYEGWKLYKSDKKNERRKKRKHKNSYN